MKGYYQVTIHLISYKFVVDQRAEILDLSFHLFISSICALKEVYMVMADIYLSS